MNKLGDVEVGEVIYMRVSGVYTPFRVLHKGRPDTSVYEYAMENCSIVCLDWQAKPFLTQAVADPAAPKGNYGASYLHQALHQVWLPRLDSAMREKVVEVRLPYRTDTDGSTYHVSMNSAGLSAKVWLPSIAEVTHTMKGSTGYTDIYVWEGSRMSYWRDLSARERSAWSHWEGGRELGMATRTPNIEYGDDPKAPYFYRINEGGTAIPGEENLVAARPCMVLPDSLPVDQDEHLHMNGSAQVKVNGIWKEGSVACKINGVWRECDAVASRVGGVWKE